MINFFSFGGIWTQDLPICSLAQIHFFEAFASPLLAFSSKLVDQISHSYPPPAGGAQCWCQFTYKPVYVEEGWLKPVFQLSPSNRMGFKAMRKEIISVFSWFLKDETNFFSYSNLIQNLIDSFVFAKFSRNTCGRKCKTRIHENDSKILEVRNHCTKIIEYFVYFRK